MRAKTKEDFLASARTKWGSKYDYSPVNFQGMRTKVSIICPQHGVIDMTPVRHLESVSGCNQCGKVSDKAGGRIPQGTYISLCIKKHLGFYGYEKTVFRGYNFGTVLITCPKHGDFEQNPRTHLNATTNSACPKCYKAYRANASKKGLPWFIARAMAVHGDRYDYSNSVYVDQNTNVEIICAEHGVFIQNASNHIQGSKCPKCAKKDLRENTLPEISEEYFRRATELYAGKYDYSNSVYTGASNKIEVVCKTHGKFIRAASYHLDGSGCPVCVKVVLLAQREKAFQATIVKRYQQFLIRANKVHRDLYTYNADSFVNNADKLLITCKEHGEFPQGVQEHLKGSGCPRCSIGKSRYEEIIRVILDGLGVKYIVRDKSGLAGKGASQNLELDFLLPEHNLAIEVNGNFFHSDFKKPTSWARSHQKEKQDNCKANSIDLLHFYSDEVYYKQDRVRDIIAAKIGQLGVAIFARKSSIVELEWETAAKFIDANHIQGRPRPVKVKGLVYQGALVAVMAFGKLTSHRGNLDAAKYEMIRYCSSTRVTGGCSKLLKSFLKDTPECAVVVSYSDNRLSNGKMYESLGFDLSSERKPDYYYTGHTDLKRQHKSNFRRAALAKLFTNFDPNLSERENCRNNKLYQIYNCGLKRWELTLNP